MRKKHNLEEINKELEKGEKGVPGWIYFLIGAFIIGFIFRYTIADTIRGNSKKKDDIKTIVWSEPYTIEYEEKGSGKLENTISDTSIILDGVYYHLPCPIYRFIENGWSVDIAGNTNKAIVYTVPPKSSRVVSLNKDNKEIKVVSVVSPNDEEVSISESFVSGLSVFSWTEAELELPKNIKIGTTKKEIEIIIKEENLEYDKEKLEKEDVYEITIKCDSDKYEEYRIKLALKEDKVEEIRVEVIYKIS